MYLFIYFHFCSFNRSAENDEDIEGKYQPDSPRSENGLGAGDILNYLKLS